jgi:hypothetical protein
VCAKYAGAEITRANTVFYSKLLKLKNMWDFVELANQLYEKQIIALPFQEIVDGNERA